MRVRVAEGLLEVPEGERFVPRTGAEGAVMGLFRTVFFDFGILGHDVIGFSSD